MFRLKPFRPLRVIPIAKINYTPVRYQLRFLTIKPVQKINNNVYRYLIKPGLIVVGVGGSIYIIDKYAYASLITRSIRAIYILLWIAYEYSVNVSKYSHINELHEIAAESLLNLLRTNKGLYIKLGQAIANQGNIFPVAYQKRFVKLYDDAPVESWKRIDKVLRSNLGENYESEIFEWLDHEPIASASIAQVHKGILKSNGDCVAVKVQHDYIGKQIIVDLFVYRFISKIYEKVFDIPLSFFTMYVSNQLKTETNFINEMHNSEKLMNLINNDSSLKNSNIYIPKAYANLTKGQVLITEWIDGVSLSNKDELIRKHFDLKIIMNQYLKVFGKQIFHYGFVHSDPHPGNLIARFDEKGKQQLVLLDHGLYVELPEKFRTEYCRLWEYLFSLNTKGIERIGHTWGIQSVELFATLIRLRPLKLTEPDEKDERNLNNLFKDFISDKKKFPLELLLLSRTMRMIQNLNQSLGSPVNRINILTNESINSLIRTNTGLVEYFNLIKIKFALFFGDLVFFVIRLRQILKGDKYGGKGAGIEDYIEMYMQNTAKSVGIEWV